MEPFNYHNFVFRIILGFLDVESKLCVIGSAKIFPVSDGFSTFGFYINNIRGKILLANGLGLTIKDVA